MTLVDVRTQPHLTNEPIAIYLNGRRLNDCVAADDVGGWVERIRVDGTTFVEKGSVRILWEGGLLRSR